MWLYSKGQLPCSQPARMHAVGTWPFRRRSPIAFVVFIAGMTFFAHALPHLSLSLFWLWMLRLSTRHLLPFFPLNPFKLLGLCPKRYVLWTCCASLFFIVSGPFVLSFFAG